MALPEIVINDSLVRLEHELRRSRFAWQEHMEAQIRAQEQLEIAEEANLNVETLRDFLIQNNVPRTRINETLEKVER